MNGDRLCTFAHRVDPKSEYKSLKVDGDVDLLGIELSHWLVIIHHSKMRWNFSDRYSKFNLY